MDTAKLWPNNLTEAEKQALMKRLNFTAIVNLRMTLDREAEKQAQAQQEEALKSIATKADHEDSTADPSMESASNSV